MTDQQVEYFLNFLAQEAELIHSHEFGVVDGRLEEKNKLCDAFEKYMEAVLEHWDDVTPERRRYLHDAMHKVRHNLAVNHKALVRAIELHRQLIKVCLDAHSSESIKLQRYDSSARTQTDSLPTLYTTIKHV